MKKMIKLTSAVLSVIILLSSLSLIASAGEVPKRYKHNGFVYSFCGKKQVALRGYVGKKKKITIPKTIKGNKVVDIDLYGNPATFKGVEEIHFPNRFGIYGMSGAKQLKKISINKSNPNYIIKSKLLLNKEGTIVLDCPGGLKNIKIPDSVTTISECSGANLRKVEFGKNVTNVELHAFSSCDKLTTIKFNNNLKEIEYSAFGWCTSLKKVKLPQGFETLGTEAFKMCTNLETVTIPSSTKLIDNGAFEECSNLKSVYIYSKNCKIDPGEYDGYYKKYLSDTIPKHATIYGYKGSTAQKYAKKNGNEFVVLK